LKKPTAQTRVTKSEQNGQKTGRSLTLLKKQW
jgi:hypothetical protein